MPERGDEKIASYNKFTKFVEDLAEGVHNFASHTLKVMLTNVAPVAANSVKADLTEIAAGNGYTAGGTQATLVTSDLSGSNYRLVVNDVTFTASGGTMATFRYAVLYNDTPTSPADPLIAWWDYGAGVALSSGESFTVDFSPTQGVLLIA